MKILRYPEDRYNLVTFNSGYHTAHRNRIPAELR